MACNRLTRAVHDVDEHPVAIFLFTPGRDVKKHSLQQLQSNT